MIRVSLIPPAVDPWERILRAFPAVIRKSLEQALELGLAASREAMGPGGTGPAVRSGRLLRSLGARVYQSGDTYIGELKADAPYAGVQEYGAVIQAKKAKYLKFRVQGQWVQVKRVVIPARPYLRPGRDAALTALPELLERNLAEAMQ
ncbi:MAG: hypothetical protein K9K66_16940 [Desulfarculaceae bacterium]|nr:hypothetical protein [Desulfarculaceae bacterium]MCF8072582.1 hypothetical protein [Desulfarculaceae bacterium]MCF8103346.1 hypothetical protein [Desulfarculaceae bacterium]MCF8117497.1 hypothetical protein [Desulfarculaceae bacterium]